MSNIITKEQEFVGNVSRYTYLVEKIEFKVENIPFLPVSKIKLAGN